MTPKEEILYIWQERQTGKSKDDKPRLNLTSLALVGVLIVGPFFYLKALNDKLARPLPELAKTPVGVVYTPTAKPTTERGDSIITIYMATPTPTKTIDTR